MADIIRNARPDRDDDDYRLAMHTLRLTAPHMSRDQLSNVVALGQTLLKDLSVRQTPFTASRTLNS